MKKIIVLLAVLNVLAVNPVAMAEPPPNVLDVHIDDGASHIFDDSAYRNSYVFLDFFMANNPGTHVDLVDDGLVYFLNARNNATITMIGGSVGRLSATGNAGVSISGGSVGTNLSVIGNVGVTMTGGLIGKDLNASGNTSVTISGGSVGAGLNAYENGTIYLDGTGFEVTDLDSVTTSLSYGDKLSDFGTIVENSFYNSYTGTITGILADGTALNNSFIISNTGEYTGTADIIIIPEPCSLVLLSLGGLMLRRKYRR